MLRLFVAVAIVALVAVIGVYRMGGEPLSGRATVDTGIEQVKKTTNLDPEQEMLLRVQLAISDYMSHNGTAPEALSELVPKYFDSEPKNPVTGQPFEYRREGKSPRIGGQVGRSSARKKSEQSSGEVVYEETITINLQAGEDFINPNTMQLEDFTYDKTGRRDPFEPFDFSEPVAPPDPDNPLTSYSLGQLRVTAIIVGPDGKRKANVEDNAGRGYIAVEGTKIGKQGGVVVHVEADHLKILETSVDFTGKESSKTVEMKITAGGPSTKKGAPRNEKRGSRR